MKKMTASVTAALVLGVLVAPTAEATTDPVYDPGSSVPSRFRFGPSKAGVGEALASGWFVEYSVSLGGNSYVKDLADDGMDTNLWVQYGKTQSYTYTERVATASGAGVSTPVTWSSPADLHVDFIRVRVCFGAGEVDCSQWAG
ncbi:hypothetical protein [Lentzea sp. NPDC004782]|uniref:hypothetical protein n=1 Tax=Lentzea sp. NPDC004782 TaxID=3154458 RepID=UPI0033BF07B2